MEEGFREIAKFDWDCLLPTMEVNVYKVKHYRKKLKEDSSIELFDPPKEDDAQVETIRVQNAVFFPFCLMKLALNKDLSPWEVFLLLEATIDTGKLACCEGILDFCQVAGTLAIAGSMKPVVARDTSGTLASVSVDLPLQWFMRKKVIGRDLIGIIPLTTKSDSLLKELTNSVTVRPRS